MSEFASNTPLEHKDRWQTPIEVFAALDAEFGFYLDAAADHGNALCARYLTESDDALNSEWESYGAIWCNPPYSALLRHHSVGRKGRRAEQSTKPASCDATPCRYVNRLVFPGTRVCR